MSDKNSVFSVSFFPISNIITKAETITLKKCVMLAIFKFPRLYLKESELKLINSKGTGRVNFVCRILAVNTICHSKVFFSTRYLSQHYLFTWSLSALNEIWDQLKSATRQRNYVHSHLPGCFPTLTIIRLCSQYHRAPPKQTNS